MMIVLVSVTTLGQPQEKLKIGEVKNGKLTVTNTDVLRAFFVDYLGKSGIGQSTIIHVGGDSVVGTPHPDVVRLFEKDEATRAVVMFGEIGTSQEERVAELIERGEFTKPLIAFIGGAAAKSGTRFSHAGAIIEGGRGTHAGKVKRLKEVGVYLVDDFDEIPRITRSVLDGLSHSS